MKTIEFAAPFAVGEDMISKAEISRLSFGKFVGISRSVVAALKPNQKMNVIMQRHRMMEQVALLSAAGKRVRMSELNVTQLPPIVGRDIAAGLFFDDDLPGELLSDSNADGISVPIHYKLGTPIAAANGKAIEELEFIAKSFGDIEEITAGEAELFQTYDLIATMAKPAGGTMLALPSWALDKISLADGIFIMNVVLPRFLK